MSMDAALLREAATDASLALGRPRITDDERRPSIARCCGRPQRVGSSVAAVGRHVQQATPGAPALSARSNPAEIVAQQRHEHQPVLVAPLVRLLEPRPGDVILDGTVGLGGHAAVLLAQLGSTGRYIGLDVDEEMVEAARERLSVVAGPRIELVAANFAEFPAVLKRLSQERVDHMLLDLGVNTAQLDDPSRGFSIDHDGPLDMRFDRRQKRKAIDLVNAMSERELADLFYEFGQEGASRKIAKRICQIRHGSRIRSTHALARAVESVFESGGVVRRGRTHPATRVFQALRVAVNEELHNLTLFLESVVEHLRPGGQLAVISFHSLEDGIVKRFLRGAKEAGTMREVTRRPVVAEPQERRANPRSRSAKMRVARRL